MLAMDEPKTLIPEPQFGRQNEAGLGSVLTQVFQVMHPPHLAEATPLAGRLSPKRMVDSYDPSLKLKEKSSMQTTMQPTDSWSNPIDV